MSDIVEKIDYKGYTVEIWYDQDVDSPRDDYGNLGVLLGFPHRNYTIGDEQMDPTEHEFECSVCHGTGLDDQGDDAPPSCSRCRNEYGESDGLVLARSHEDFMALLKAERGARVILPVGMIDHSGVAYYIGTVNRFDPGGWDSGQCGVIFDTPDTLKERWGEGYAPSNEDITKSLTQEVEIYSEWASGSCYGFSITGPDGEDLDDGSCGGFIGSDSYEEGGYMREQFVAIIEHDIRDKHEAKVALFKKLVSR